MFKDFLNSIRERVSRVFSGQLGNVLGAKPTPSLSPIPAPTPAPTPFPYSDVVLEGLTNWGRGSPPPVATESATLADLGEEIVSRHPNLPSEFRYLPAALSLKETGGLTTAGQQESNPYGIMVGGQLVRYPDIKVATLGGGNWGVDGTPQRGLKGVLLGREGEPSRYGRFLKSGDLRDFFEVYTPEGGSNPSIERQISQLQALLDYFREAEARKRSSN